MGTPLDQERILAFRVIWKKYPGVVSIVAERTWSKASSATMRHIRDVGYKPLFTEMRARRAPEFDSWAAQQPQERIGWPVSEDTAKSMRTAIVEAMERKSGCPGYEE